MVQLQVAIVTLGSRGDVQPFVALGRGLQTAGHTVRLVASVNFETMVRQQGLDFSPMTWDMQGMVNGDVGKRLLENAGANPLQLWQALRDLVREVQPLMRQTLQESWAACQSADVILHSLTAFACYRGNERSAVPRIVGCLQPFTPTRDFASLLMPPYPLGGPYNRLTHRLFEQAFWQPQRSLVNSWRVQEQHLTPLPFLDPLRQLDRQRVPVLYGYSPLVPRRGIR